MNQATKRPATASNQASNFTQANRNKALAMKTHQVSKKEMQIDSMSNDQVVNELKDKALPTFGTAQERKDRLKKANGIAQGAPEPVVVAKENPGVPKKSNCLEEIERLKQQREDRRLKMNQLRKQKTEREAANEANGIRVDVEFQQMIEDHKLNVREMAPHTSADQVKINVCIKKRPIFAHELAAGEIDCISVSNPFICIHDCKTKVDGITKFIDNQSFQFDNTYGESESNDELYSYAIAPIVDLVFNQGVITVFAYGQTGSGKTYTMQGLQDLAIKDLFDRGVYYFKQFKRNYTVTVSMYEIYGGKVYDLLNNHEKLKILEDKFQKMQIFGLKEFFVQSEEEILNLINLGNSVRTTHATKANDTSSRSHSICQIKVLEEGQKVPGRLLLVDLAGSERATDCQNNNSDRRQEGAEINKSLLALKECIRSIDSQKGQAAQGGGGGHIPFRGSKLTMVLRDSFIASDKAKIIMLTCVVPGSNSSDHTLNTLRYAERLKERPSSPPQIMMGGMHSQPPNHIMQANKGAMHQTQNVQNQQIKRNNSLLYMTNDSEDTNFRSRPQKQVAQTIQKETAPNKANKDIFYRPDQDQVMEHANEDDVQMVEEPIVFQNGKKQSPQQNPKNKFNNQSSSKRPGEPNVATQRRPVQNMQQKVAVKKQEDSFGSDQDFSQSPKGRISLGGTKQTSATLFKRKPEPAQQHKQVPVKQSPPKAQNFSPPQPSQKPVQQQQDPADLLEEMLAEEEEIINIHTECVKKDAQLLTKEGKCITEMQQTMRQSDEYNMAAYLQNVEQVAIDKLQMYQELLDSIHSFRTRYTNK